MQEASLSEWTGKNTCWDAILIVVVVDVLVVCKSHDGEVDICGISLHKLLNNLDRILQKEKGRKHLNASREERLLQECCNRRTKHLKSSRTRTAYQQYTGVLKAISPPLM